MKDKKVTTTEIAKLAGVSQSTVSMILSNSKLATFSKSTTHRVLSIAGELGYRIKNTECDVYKKSGVIAVMCPSLRNQYYSELIYVIEAEAIVAGYSVIINSTYDDEQVEEKNFDVLSSMHIDGIILLYVPKNYERLKSLFPNTPVIIVSDKGESKKIDAVEMSGYKSGLLIGEHILSLGHTNVAFISLSLQTAIIRMHRYEAIRQLFADRGLENRLFLYMSPPIKNKQQYSVFTSEYEIGYEFTGRALEEHPEITAFIGGNDLQSYGILDALADRGLRVPDEYSVCGFDNNQPSNYRGISLTSVDPIINHKGREAFMILARKMSSRWLEEEPSMTMKVEYDPKLIVRRSTGPCRKEE